METPTTLRDIMEQRIKGMVSHSTTDQIEGKVFIVYERLGDFQWLPGKSDSAFLRRIKHWRLVIQLGFECFTLEFLENSLVGRQGVILVGPFDQGARGEAEGEGGESSKNNPKLYHIGDLKGLSTDVLFNWILEQFYAWTEYNLLRKNCQDFVRHFLEFAERGEYLVNRTDHFVVAKVQQPVGEQGGVEGENEGERGREGNSTSSSSSSRWGVVRGRVGRAISGMGFGSKSMPNVLSSK